jgi:restriction system protein
MADFWVVRAGKNGERIDWCLETGVAGGGWHEVPDLTAFKDDRDALREVVLGVFEGPKGRVSTYTGQLWMLISRIKVGDYVVLPVRSTSSLAIGRVNKAYFYNSKDEDPTKRHLLGVEWLKMDIPKSIVKQDLIFQLNSALTLFFVGNNDAAYRLEQLLEGKADPGARSAMSDSRVQPKPAEPSDGLEVDSNQVLNLEEIAQDEIAKRLQEDFMGHELSELVEALLTAEGYKCRNSPPGPDGGVDVLAGMGPFGMDSPRLVVQVKSQSSAVGDAVLQQLKGAMHSYQADQALLVTFAGITAPAKSQLVNQHFNIRVWTMEDILESIYRNYAALPNEMKARLPLKQIWIPLSEDS